MRIAKTLIRQGGCPGWSESSLGAHSFCWFCRVAAHFVVYHIYSVYQSSKAAQQDCNNFGLKTIRAGMQKKSLYACMCVHRSLRSICETAVWSEFSLSVWSNFGYLATHGPPSKLLIRLCRCTGLSESVDALIICRLCSIFCCYKQKLFVIDLVKFITCNVFSQFLCHYHNNFICPSIGIVHSHGFRCVHDVPLWIVIWTASSEFGTYRLCEQRRFRRACASAQTRQNLRCSLIQAVSQEEPSDRKSDPWPLWMSGHAQLKFVMTECSKTQIRLTGLIL